MVGAASAGLHDWGAGVSGVRPADFSDLHQHRWLATAVCPGLGSLSGDGGWAGSGESGHGGTGVPLLPSEQGGPLFRLGVGVLLLFLAGIVPYLGWLVVAAPAALGFGAVLWTRGGDVYGWSLDGVEGIDQAD